MQKKNIASKKKYRSLFHRILRFFTFLLIGLVGIVMLLTGYFYLDRDEIGRRVLLYTNNLTQGELSFEDITFNPLKHFPAISLLLKDVVYYENHVDSRNQNEKAIYEIERLYAALDIIELISGKIQVSKVSLHNGNIHLVRYPDSTLNLLNAFKPYEQKDEGSLSDSSGTEQDHDMDLDLDYIIDIQGGEFKVNTEKSKLLSKAGKGEYLLAPFAEVPYFKLNYKVEGIEVSEILTTLKADTIISGTLDVYMDLSSEGRNKEELLHGLNGEVTLYGEDLLLCGVDLDEVIKKFKRSQNFNLVDVGAVMVAGPAGLAITKGSSYAAMLVANFGDTSLVTEMVSDWQLENGSIKLRDVAFSTEESMVAAKGWLNFQKDSLDISFAVIDKRGCSIIGQDLYGHINDPERSKIKLIATLLAPVTNLVEISLGIDCEPFYEGRIKHPKKKP